MTVLADTPVWIAHLQGVVICSCELTEFVHSIASLSYLTSVTKRSGIWA